MKQLLKTIPASTNGKSYEIRVYLGESNSAAGFLEGKQVTPCYGVAMNVDFDFRTYTGEWAHDRLVPLVQEDIEALECHATGTKYSNLLKTLVENKFKGGRG
jgi:hypothetical protein